jgi:type I restriction enzyme S subunit
MEVRPGYKQTDVGVIPKTWNVESLGELFLFRNGVNADKDAYGQGVRFVNVLEPITYSHIHGPEITGLVTLPESAIESYAVRCGDVLFNRTSETQEEVGLAATYLGSERVVFGGFVIRGRPTSGTLDPTYSGYALRAPCIRSQIIPMGQGAIRANIGQSNLRLVVAPLPPLPEQSAIAAALKDVDALLLGLTQLVTKKRDIKQAAMQQLLTGRVRLPGSHGEWEVKKLREVVSTPITDGPHLTPTFLADGVPFLSVNNLVNNQLDLRAIRFVSKEDHLEFSKKCKPRKGDILFGKAASVGMVALIETDVELNIWSPLAMIRVSHKASARFVCYALQASHVGRQIKLLTNSSSQGNIGMEEIGLLEIPLPTPDEQIAIATVLGDMDAELAALEARRDKTRALKQAMMQELLTGRTRLV